jgi:cell division protein FtsW (lipid II flippase)
MRRLWQQLGIATNWPILAAMAVLCLLGIISVWADSPADARKQLAFMAVGMVCLILLQTVSYLYLGQYAWPFYLLGLLLIAYTILPFERVPLVREIKGSRAWINLGPLSLQPAELMKIGFCLVMARYLRFRSNYRSLAGLIPPFVLALVPLVVILRQPDLGTALVFVPALFAMLFAAGAKLRHLLGIVTLGVVTLPVIWLAGTDTPVLKHLPPLVRNYQRSRIKVMFSEDPRIVQRFGYQQAHALMAFGSGGWTGRGPFNIPVGRQVPEAHNDMIFALIGEQFGFVGAAVTLAAYLVLFAAGIEIAAATKEPFGRLVAVGIVAMLAGQTFLNLLVCVRLMPVTGVTLPFVSYGGSSLLASFIAAGLLLNIGQNRPLMIGRTAFEFD